MLARTRIGVLALQGAFAAHAAALQRLGASTAEVRVAVDLEQCDALVLPGGESTTMSQLLGTSQLFDPLAKRIAAGMPVFGTCAGMILLSRGIADGRPDQRSFAALDIDVQRNGFGRQLDSFETEIDVLGLDRAFHAVFIRAPRISRIGSEIETLATHGGEPVLVRSKTVMAASFHPELADDDRVHQLFLNMVQG
jgi:5'-phosphate synthase pdxT subunit